MIRYKKFQFGWVIVVVFLIVIVWLTLSYIHQWGNNPLDTFGYFFLLTLFGGILLTFFGITIIVTDKYFVIKYGIGLFNKRINLDTIQSVSVVQSPIYYGYGIRIIPGGLLYNVSGKHAIELKLKGKKPVIQIGTNDWVSLKDVVEKSLSI